MKLLEHLNPAAGAGDLWTYITTRRPHQIGFMALALTVTGVILWGFWHDSQIKPEYKPNIIYVESWPITRTDREIIEQQKKDMVAKKKRQAELDAKREKRRQEFKKIDDGLKAWGI